MKYCWESPDPGRWSSHFIFDSYEDAKTSAIMHARNSRTGKKRYQIELEPSQRKLVWRSMRKAGWKIRRKLANL